MSYPAMIDYHEAVQDPARSFTDPILQAGKVQLSPLGLPVAMSGGFVLTYGMVSSGKRYAVRCFHKEVPEAQARYEAISRMLSSRSASYFVPFVFQPKGIRIRGALYPIVRMDWAVGETLGQHLDKVARDPVAIGSLRQRFRKLAEHLGSNGIAHGDLQNENVIVSDGELKLIDYDGMFVDGMQVGRGSEVGHKHFQHPQRDTANFGPRMDRFSFIVLDISLAAIGANAGLHARFKEGGQAIIFKANDFADPGSSEAFKATRAIASLEESIRKFEAVCSAPIAAVPTLEDFIAGKNIPQLIAKPVRSEASASVAIKYMGAFDVVDASDFDAVLSRVGDRIELVGQVVSVKNGVGTRGRGRGLPYVFINFGAWNQESVKVTIWSEGLNKISDKPDSGWAGRWISVSGLIEPPYEGAHRGRAYRNVGVTVTADGQILQLSATDARFRLGKSKGASATPATGNRSNAEILSQMRGASPPPAPRIATAARRASRQTPAPAKAASPSIPAKTKNEQILASIRRAPGPSQPALQPTPSTSTKTEVPGWVWLIAGLVVLAVLSRCGA